MDRWKGQDMPVYNKQKIHLTRADIPNDTSDRIILRKMTDLYHCTPEEIPKIHPYCLGLSSIVAEYLPLELQTAFTPQQIIYIPDGSLSYFSTSFFEYWLEQKEEVQKEYEFLYRIRHTDGHYTEEKETVRLFDRLLLAKAQKTFREEVNQKKKDVRMCKNAEVWKQTNRITSRELMECLDMSSKGVDLLFGEIQTETKPKSYDYKQVLQIIERSIHIAPESRQSKFVKEELAQWGKVEEGNFVLERLPVLYQNQEMLRQLGFVFSGSSNEISEEIRDICLREQVLFHFEKLKARGIRYSKGAILALNRNLDMRAKREKNNAEFQEIPIKTCFFDY